MKVLICLLVIVATFAVINAAASHSSSCFLPADPGHCFARIERYAYSKDGGCKKFIYGGCGGNGNNFKTQEECHAACLYYKP